MSPRNPPWSDPPGLVPLAGTRSPGSSLALIHANIPGLGGAETQDDRASLMAQAQAQAQVQAMRVPRGSLRIGVRSRRTATMADPAPMTPRNTKP